MVFVFAGQLTGTAAGNRLYAEGGWVWSSSLSIAVIGTGIIVGMARGPRETGWVGWKGGWSIRKDRGDVAEKSDTQAVLEEGREPPAREIDEAKQAGET
jgi:hypothetical protein